MRQTLGRTGIYPYFDGRIFSASEVAHGKPAPDLFLHAAKQMGVPPSACIVVEDSKYGIQAARAAGMRALGYAGGLPGRPCLVTRTLCACTRRSHTWRALAYRPRLVSS
jgi:beta-phosphoglucomutase-like phosphatase (HAD superfamily)